MNNLNISVMRAPGIAVAGSLLLAMPAIAHGHHGHGNGPRGGQNFVPQQNHAARLAGLTNRSQVINEAGRVQSVFRGLELDLTSANRSIVLGERLFRGAGSYTINAGGEAKVLAAGTRVSAAEYVALQQVIAGGAQGLVVDGTGRGVEGNFDLNSINDGGAKLRAGSLVVPQNVTAVGDFSRRADGLRVTNDLVNHGSIYAYTSNGPNNTVRISARDINNDVNGVISTDFPLTFAENNNSTNLSLRADRNINNAGAIISAGNLDLSAGGALNNAASGSIRANGNVTVNSSTVTNSGTIGSNKGDVNFAGVGDANLTVNNLGGTISAANGAINIRYEGYNGTGNSTVTGGDLLSRDLNLFTGLGTTDVQVNELTGVVNSSGSAAHVSSQTDTLTIGQQCLVGDPTYFNTGNIVLGGNIDVGEDLAIIAGGNITTTSASLLIRARNSLIGTGANIVMIAGATVSGGPGEVPPAGTTGILPAQGPGFTDNATGPVTVDVTTGKGGNIDLTGATTSLLIDTTPSLASAFGGNITLAAYEFSSNGGRVILPTTSNVNASGSGTSTNGNISIFGGATTGTAITLGNVNARAATGTAQGTGDVLIVSQNARTTDGQDIVFGTKGQITSSNFLTQQQFFGTGSGGISIQDINASGDVTVRGHGLTQVNNINASGTQASDSGGAVKVTSLEANVKVNGAINANGGSSATGGTVDITSLTSDVLVSGVITADSGGSAAGGTVNISSNSVVTPTTLNGISATGGKGDGGTINVSNTDTGGIFLSSGVYVVSGANGGKISFDTQGVLDYDQAIVDAGTLGISGNNGTITIVSTLIQGTPTGQLQLLSENGDGGTVSVTTTGAGVVTNGGSFEIRAQSLGGIINLNLLDNTINADGLAGGAGGNITLASQTINFASTSAKPLVLTANGDKASAGAINYSNDSIVPTFIGTPTKLPKGAANFLSVGANGGNTTGDGGTLIVAVGGNLTVQSNTIDLAPGPGGGVGATIFFGAAGLLPKGGSLIVNGDLNADSTGGFAGGSILLSTNNKKTFVVGSKKLPKNGVFGKLSAQGLASGSISLINNSGGVQIANSNALGAHDISLNAGAKGKISTANGVTITAGNQIQAFSNEGDISLLVSSNVIGVNSNLGKVKITDTTIADTTLLDSFTGDDFELITSGALSVNDIGVADGDIKVVMQSVAGGLLQISGTAVIEAVNGGIVIQNSNLTTGSIDIMAGATIQTQGKGKNVVIAIGPAPKKGVNPAPPFFPGPNFNLSTTGKGQIFFGVNPNDVIATGAVSINGLNKSVIFNNGSSNTALNKITLGTGATVTADPPSHPRAGTFSLDSIKFEPMLTSSSASDASSSPSNVDTIPGSSQVQSSMTLPTDLLGNAKDNALTNADSALEQFATMGGDSSRSVVWGTNVRNAFVWSDDDLGLNEVMMIERTKSGDASFEKGSLRKGAVVFAPSKQTEIETPFGTVSIEKDAIAFVIIDGNKLAVYDLHDSKQGAITVSTDAAKHVLQPGRCAVITNKVHHQFEHANPMQSVGYRSLSTNVVNGLKIFKGEFSTVHAINSIAPLQAVLSGKKNSAKHLRDRLLKTTAVLMHLGTTRDTFRAYAEPDVTAMK